MNVEKLMRVVEWLEAGVPVVDKMVGFNMAGIIEPAGIYYAVQNDGSEYFPECGTVCCIAGALVQFEMQDRLGQMADCDDEAYDAGFVVNNSIIETGSLLADIDGDTGIRLFIPNIDLGRATPAEAAKVLRNFIESGKITWHEVVAQRPATPTED